MESLGRYLEAEEAFRAAIQRDPRHAAPWTSLGNLLRHHLGRFAEAEEAYRSAIQLDPKDSWPWTNLGILLVENLGRYREAEAAFRSAIQFEPGNGDLWTNLGKLLMEQLDRHREAEKALRHSLALDPTNPRSSNSLAWHLHLHGDPTEALAHSTRAVELAPDNPHNTHTHACCLIANRKTSEARPFVHHVVTHDDPSFHDKTWPDILHLFRLLVRADHAATAVSWLEDWGLADRWLPLRTALQALAVDDEDVLLSVAPEVRGAARTVLEQLRADPT